MWDIKRVYFFILGLISLRFIWTMWDIKSVIKDAEIPLYKFYLNYVGYKVYVKTASPFFLYPFYLNYVGYKVYKLKN